MDLLKTSDILELIIRLNADSIQFVLTKSRILDIQYYHMDLMFDRYMCELTFDNSGFLYANVNDDCTEDLNEIYEIINQVKNDKQKD